MADIAASDVTVTVESREIIGKKTRNFVKITFGNGTLTYPSGGVPLPAIGKFGMRQRLDYLIPFGHTTGITWKYDTPNKKLRGYEGDYAQTGDASLVELDAASDAPAAQTIYAEVIGR